MKVKELLARPESWTQKAFARNTNGERVTSSDDTACRWCLVGALNRCYSDKHEEWDAATTRILRAIGRLGMPMSGELTALTAFNDWPGTTHADVLRVLEQADV